MSVGRCLPVNYQIGCNATVTDLVASRCDGKKSCIISLPDRELHLRNTCPKELKTYLEVNYECGKGESGSVHVHVLY